MAEQSRARRLTAHAVVPWLVVAALVGVASWRQSAGFTHYPLFFDDAWAALPAHYNAVTALRMSVSTPGWTELLRLWIRAGSYASWWAQLPSFLAAIVVGFATFALCRRVGFARWPSVVAVAMLVTNPTTLEFATRVKPYTVEMALAVVLLAAGESVRRRRDARSLVVLAAVTFVAFAISFSVFSVVAGVWLAALVWLRDEPALRRRWVVAVCGAGALVLAVGLPYYLTSSARLGDNWQRRGYLEGYQNLHEVVHNAVKMFAGFVNGWADVPIGATHFDGHLTGLTYVDAVIGVLVLAALVWCCAAPAAWRNRPQLVPVGFTMLVATVLAFGEVLPFGDGRTDEVLYPGLALVVAAVVQGVVRVVAPRLNHRVVVAVLVAVAAVLTTANLSSNQALYPQANLAGLYQRLRAQLHPGDVIVVPAYLSFSWAEAGLTPTRLQLDPPGDWPQGFRMYAVTSGRDHVPVILPKAYSGNDPQLVGLQHHYRVVWYIGYDVGVWDPYAVTPTFAADIPMPTYTHSQLVAEGWQPLAYPINALNCYAQPYVWRGPSKSTTAAG